MHLSYRKKISLLIGCVFIIIMISLSYLLIQTLSEQNLINIEKQLSFTSKLIDEELHEIVDDMMYYAAQSISIPELSKNLSTMSPDELRKALNALKDEFRADRVLLIQPNLSVLSDTNTAHQESKIFPYPHLVDYLNEKEPFSFILPLNNVIYHWISFPLRIEDKIVWLTFGNKMDKIFSHNLEKISPLKVNLSFAYELPATRWHFSEELPFFGTRLDSTLNTLLSHYNENYQKAISIKKNGYIIFMLPLRQLEKSPKVIAILIYSFSESFENYLPLIYQTILLFITAFLALTVGFIIINTRYRNTIIKISHFVEKMNQGNYNDYLTTTHKGILGKLSSLLNSTVQKISQREKELLHHSLFDSVTELPNKRYFIDHLNKEIEVFRNKHLAVAIVDISHFSRIDHALGHRIADRLLHHVGARIVNAFPDAVFFSRISSHSFSILFSNTKPSDAHSIANRILDLFENPFSVYTVTIDLGAHVGFSFYPNDGYASDVLIQKADVALVNAQMKQERYALYDVAHDPHQFNKLSLMSELREAIINDELCIYYQPKIDLRLDKVVQVEALVRWEHNYKGFLSAHQFVPLAEETGHIKRITAWLINKCFAQCEFWEKNNINLKISINLSVKDLLNKSFIHTVTHALKTHSIKPENIFFEITESAFIQEPLKVLDTINRLKEIGFSFIIDDFGSGYSSMAYLKHLPVDKIKIDKEFIQDILNNEKDSKIVRSTIELGHQLELEVVAEGIEDEASYELLKTLGCDIGQGFYMANPMPLHELEEWLSQSKWGL